MFFHHHRWRRKKHRRRDPRIVLDLDNFAVELITGEVVHMATTMKVGQKLPLSIRYLDASGAEITPAPTLDAVPLWQHNNPAAGTLTPSADGTSAELDAMAAGSDTIRLSLSVGGNQFQATIDVTVEAVAPPPPVVASIEIVAGTPV